MLVAGWSTVESPLNDGGDGNRIPSCYVVIVASLTEPPVAVWAKKYPVTAAVALVQAPKVSVPVACREAVKLPAELVTGPLNQELFDIMALAPVAD